VGASPAWKVYDADNKYTASFKDVYEACRYVSICDTGTEVRYGHGKKGSGFAQRIDGDAWESLDQAVEVIAEKNPHLFRTAN